jgi:hypothetical protein
MLHRLLSADLRLKLALLLLSRIAVLWLQPMASNTALAAQTHVQHCPSLQTASSAGIHRVL